MSLQWIRLLSGLILAVALFSATAAGASNRSALVVGIDRYEALPPLSKAVNDARAMASTLERLDFEVHAGYDLTRREFTGLLADFISALQPGDEALIFYAGHAVEIERRNYLVPVDATQVVQSNEALIISESVAQDFILQQIASRDVQLTVLILDACRDNPFVGLRTRSTGLTRGLAIESPPQGTFLMFSADEGQQALDSLGEGDSNPNSVFTRTLLPLLETPGLDIVEIARQARGQVEALARSIDHAQFPEYRDRMRGTGRFVLMPTHAAVAQPHTTALSRCEQADSEFRNLPVGEAAALRQFLKAYPDCTRVAAEANARLSTLTTVSLAVAPASVGQGEFVTIQADLPAACVPAFFNLAPSGRLTPIPNDFFRQSAQQPDRTLWEITQDTDYAVVVQEEDERGPNRLGVICTPKPVDNAGVVAVLKELLPQFAKGHDGGLLNFADLGQISFESRVFTIR